MGVPELKNSITYAEYLTWNDDQRCEIIDGEIYNMSPAPSLRHQSILGELHLQIASHLSGGPCKVFIAPLDVRLPETIKNNDKIIDVVQPDILVVCDQSILDEQGCHGAPDFIIEILSPSTATKDTIIKLALYERNKVKEYWIVDPVIKHVYVYVLGNDDRYQPPVIYGEDKKIISIIIEKLQVDLSTVF